MQILTHVDDPAVNAALGRLCREASITAVPVSSVAIADSAFFLGTQEAQGKVLFVDTSPDAAEIVAKLRDYKLPTLVVALRLKENGPLATRMLREGADDVLTIPMDPEEFAARVSAVTRRGFGLNSDKITVGEVHAFLDGRDPEIAGVSVSLTRREQEVLRLLALHPGQMVTKEALFEGLYGMLDEPPLAKVVEVHVCTLRKKLRNASQTGWTYIETVKRRGYRLAPPP